jgi:RNA-binding protein YlmH
MDKKSFVNFINSGDENLISNLYDKILLAERINKTVYSSEFYPPSIWTNLIKASDKFDVNIIAYGVFEEAEKRMIAMSKIKFDDYPVRLLKITNGSNFIKLKHSDYLGAVMALSIKRNKFGDFIVSENSCYFPAFNEVCDFIKANLLSVGKCPCSIQILDKTMDKELLPKIMLNETIINSTSLRLDCIIAAICNISRNKATELINSKKVLVNFEPITQKDFNVEFKTILTIRGYGKYKIEGQAGSTLKGKIKLKVEKYI